jgi:hypothetical protein
MSVQVFPVPTTAATPEFSIPIKFTPASTSYIEYPYAVEAGVYNVITSSSTATVYFYDGGTLLATISATTSNVELNLATAAKQVAIVAGTANINVTITKTFRTLASTSVSGTLYTITATSSNYSIPTSTLGKQYVMCVGAGGGGGRGSPNNTAWPGSGGGSGALVTGGTQLSGTISVTIGAKGNSATNVSNSGGTTSWGNYVSAPGGSGGNEGEQGNNAGGAGGSPNGGAGGAASQNNVNGAPGVASTSPSNFAWIKSGTTGGGGAGTLAYTSGNGGAGAGSGIGTGGTGGRMNVRAGTAATGYGAGGGGGAGGDNNGNGGTGSDGVIYLIVV